MFSLKETEERKTNYISLAINFRMSTKCHHKVTKSMAFIPHIYTILFVYLYMGGMSICVDKK